jgi:hypothetical protein
MAVAYDVTDRDVSAICGQLKVFGDWWDKTAPPGASEQEKAELPRQIHEKVTAASAQLRRLAPTDLADDVARQVQVFEGMMAQYAPSAGIAPPSAPNTATLDQVGRDQARINSFAESHCGFTVWN